MSLARIARTACKGHVPPLPGSQPQVLPSRSESKYLTGTILFVLIRKPQTIYTRASKPRSNLHMTIRGDFIAQMIVHTVLQLLRMGAPCTVYCINGSGNPNSIQTEREVQKPPGVFLARKSHAKSLQVQIMEAIFHFKDQLNPIIISRHCGYTNV